MTSIRILTLAFVLVLCSCASSSGVRAIDVATLPRLDDVVVEEAAESEPILAVLIGNRELDDEAFPVDEHDVFGLEFSSNDDDANVEIGFLSSSDDELVFISGLGNFDFELTLKELYFGFRAAATKGRLRPYVGGGITLVDAELSVSDGVSSASEDDTVVGGYVHAGVHFLATERFFAGVDLRATFGTKPEFAGIELDVTYTQIAAVIGFGL